MILKIVSSSILMVVLRAAPCQISHCWMYLLSPFSKNCQNTVLYSPIMVFIWSFNFSLLESQSTCPEIIHVKFQISGCILQFPFLKMAKILLSYGLNMVLTLSFKLVFLNPQQYSKGYFMPNFTLLCVSYGPLSYKWPKYGPFMAKTWLSYDTTTWFILNLNQCAKRYSMPNFILLGVSCSPLSRNGQNMALLWPKNGPQMVRT